MTGGEMSNELEKFQIEINTFEAAYNRMRQSLKEMVEQMTALNITWEGSAHDMFMQQFITDKNRIEEALKRDAEFLHDLKYANTEYNKCERAVNEIVNSIRI